MDRFDFAWCFAVIGLSSVACFGAGRELGATFDEPFYLEKGLESHRTGSYRALMRAGTLPLPVDLQTLPLALRDQPDFNDRLRIARAMNLPFWWLLLLSSFRLARRFGGPWAGRFAIAFTASEPSLSAHAALATTDIAVTALILAFAESLHRGRGRAWWQRVLIPGLCYGTAILCKASAILFCPLVFLVLAWPLRRSWAESRSQLIDFAQLFGIAAVVAFAYCGSDWKEQASFVRWADSLPDSPGCAEIRTAAHALKIFPNAGEGLAMQVKHNIRGHGCYTLGEWHPRAVWYYFPVVFSQKLAEPTLVLLALALILRPRAAANPMLLLAFVLFVFSLTCRVQIGIRLQFPCVAFLLIGLPVSFLQPLPASVGNRPSLAILSVSLLAALGIAAESWPNGLRYCNRLWGGAAQAPELLTDSNSDWGQGLPELQRWAEARGLERLPIWYYGADPAARSAPFELMQVNHWAEPNVCELRKQVGPQRLLAVGLSLLTGCPDRRPETLAVIEWLKKQNRIATVGTTAIFELE